MDGLFIDTNIAGFSESETVFIENESLVNADDFDDHMVSGDVSFYESQRFSESVENNISVADAANMILSDVVDYIYDSFDIIKPSDNMFTSTELITSESFIFGHTMESLYTSSQSGIIQELQDFEHSIIIKQSDTIDFTENKSNSGFLPNEVRFSIKENDKEKRNLVIIKDTILASEVTDIQGDNTIDT